MHAPEKRLVEIAKRAFRVASPLRRQALLDHLKTSLNCSGAQAIFLLHELQDAGLVHVRGGSTAALVFPGPSMDTKELRIKGFDVPYGLSQ